MDNMNFGFSYIGLLYLLMLLVPNILWTRHKPVDYDKYVTRENRILAAFERIGHIGIHAGHARECGESI